MMKDALAVSFYTCDLATHQQERINDPCGKWLWEWIGIEPDIPDQWLIDNSSTYTELQLNYIYVANQDLLAGAEEDVIQCEADRLVVTPTVEPGWTLRVTTDLNNITTSSDYQITDNRKSTQLTVNFGDGTGDNAGCSPLPLELFSVVTDTYFTVFNEISGEWTLTGTILDEPTSQRITCGNYGQTVFFNVGDWTIRHQFTLAMPSLAVFGPLFTTTIPESVIHRVDVEQVLSYEFRSDFLGINLGVTYLAVGQEILHVESGQSVFFSALDSNEQQSPNTLYSFSEPAVVETESIHLSKTIDFDPKYFSNLNFHVPADYGLPPNGTFEISYFLLAAGFSSRRYDIISNAANPDYIPKDMAFNPIFLNNYPTVNTYTPGDYGVLKDTISHLIPLNLKTALEITLSHSQQKGWSYYQIDITNTSNLDLYLAFNGLDNVYPINWWLSLPSEVTKSIYLSAAHSGYGSDYNQATVYLTETDGTRSAPVDMPEMTLDGNYQLNRFDDTGSLGATGTSIDSWTMPAASPLVYPDLVGATDPNWANLRPNDFQVFAGNLSHVISFEGEKFVNDVWEFRSQMSEPLGLDIYLPIIESFGLNITQFKIKPGDAETGVLTPNPAVDETYFCRGVYTLSDVYVSQAQIFNAIETYFESMVNENTGDPIYRNLNLAPYNVFGFNLNRIHPSDYRIPIDQGAVLSATGFATYLTINL